MWKGKLYYPCRTRKPDLIGWARSDFPRSSLALLTWGTFRSLQFTHYLRLSNQRENGHASESQTSWQPSATYRTHIGARRSARNRIPFLHPDLSYYTNHVERGGEASPPFSSRNFNGFAVAWTSMRAYFRLFHASVGSTQASCYWSSKIKHILCCFAGKFQVVSSPVIDFRKSKELSNLNSLIIDYFAAGNRLNSGGGHHGPVITVSLPTLSSIVLERFQKNQVELARVLPKNRFKKIVYLCFTFCWKTRLGFSIWCS